MPSTDSNDREIAARIELTDEARDALLWGGSSGIGERIDGADNVDEYETLVNLARVNAIIWRAALAGVLMPTPEAHDWLRRTRGSLLGVIRDDRNQLALPRHEYPQLSDEEFELGQLESERLLERDLAMLAAVEDLLALVGRATLKRTAVS